MGALWMLVHAALAAAQSQEVPDLRRTEDGQLVIEAPDRERTTYRVQFNTQTRLSASERLQRLIGLEPFEVVEENAEAATATVRLTATGADRLARPVSWEHLAATSITPQPQPYRPRCVQISIDLAGQESEIWGTPAPCPESDIATQLVVEGLNSRGARLWLVAADDPRNVRSVLGPNGEPHVTGRDEGQAISVTVSVSTVEDLRTIRWYEVTEGNRLRRIGQSRWRPSR